MEVAGCGTLEGVVSSIGSAITMKVKSKRDRSIATKLLSQEQRREKKEKKSQRPLPARATSYTFNAYSVHSL
jgi:hypothetical protein